MTPVTSPAAEAPAPRVLQLLRRRLRRTVRGDRGFSLIELLVAMGLLTVLLVLAGALFIGASKVSTSARYASVDSGVATNVMNEASNVVRFGTKIRAVTNSCNSVPAVVQATASTFLVYSGLAGDPVTATGAAPALVLLTVDANGNLIEKQWAATKITNGCITYPTISTAGVPATVSAAPVSTRIIGGPLTKSPSGGYALFSYADATGAAVPLSSGQVASGSLVNIASVQLDVAVDTSKGSSKIPVHLQGSVSLQNPGTEF